MTWLPMSPTFALSDAPAEHAGAITRGSEAELDVTSGVGLLSGFLQSAARNPEGMAIRNGSKCWTYAQAEQTARRWAGLITEVCGGYPQRVGIFAARGETHSIGVLSTLFSRATFVPLNPSFPESRTQSMIEQAAPEVVIVEASQVQKFAAIMMKLEQRPIIIVPEPTTPPVLIPNAWVLDHEDIRRAIPLEGVPSVKLDTPAYLLFTSGSTGNPKGVPVSHSNVLHFLKINQARYKLTTEDRLTHTFEPTFDLSVFDLFMAWGAGACSCVIPSLALLSPFRMLKEQGITVWFSVPSVGALLRKKNLLTPGSLPSLRWSLFCGEPLPRATAEAWQMAANQSVVENLYGPTELTIACSTYRWDPEHSGSECENEIVPIGHLYEGLEPLVVDADLKEVAPGEVGELCVGGPQTFEGYWHNPEKTAQAFIVRTDAAGNTKRYYRTGDRVCQLADGGFVHRGRVDFQVKVQGYRVELGEIEAALRRQPGVVETCAIGWPMVNGSAEGIVAFVAGTARDAAAIIAAVKSQLPNYMVPKAVHILDELPLNSNGKVDRKALDRFLVPLDRAA